MTYQPISQFPVLKGLVASNQPLSQPKGSFPRGSNLVLMERGALTPCDGSGIINWFSGAVQNNRGRFMSLFLYEPTGVNPYYLAIARVLKPLGAPANLAASASAGGSLAATTYFYKVTALDGVGGETQASAEATATTAGGNLSVTLTWNVVPNAFGYNVYRSTTTGMEVLLTGGGLPKLQPNPLTGTVTYIDNGSATLFPGGGFAITNITTPADFDNFAYITLAVPATLHPGQILNVVGNSITAWNAVVTVSIVFSSTSYRIDSPVFGPYAMGTVGTGGTLTGGASPPSFDSTVQTALYQMPRGSSIPVSYSDSNIVAYYPAAQNALGQVPTGGSGGGGTTGQGVIGPGTSTPSGGLQGLVGPLPQMKQFTNRVMIALGNGFAPQMFSDPTGTPVNPAFTGAITSVAVSNDEVTITTTATLTAQNLPVGSNVVLNMSDTTYNGASVVISVNTGAGTFVIRNIFNDGGASTGTFTVSTTPIISTFTPAYPVWTASTAYAVGDIIVPLTQPTPNVYLTATQQGVSGTVEPAWDSTIGDQFSDGSVIWTVAALLNSAAPPPPGAGHIEVYAGSLWVLNTSPTNTANGLDGPCALRMSNTNNPNAWNPVNQAFLDKDDGAEGMGLGKFTITAQGIPPEGSLIAFKYRVPYQIIGVFGANNFAIQPVSSDMGCLAPRSITFVPGYGLMRYSHLGIAVFNGFRDEVISEQIRPYLFPVNDFDARDIVVADANYLPLSWAAQTANPPMYAFAMPIGNSNGQLTRMMLYDLVLKAWAAPVDLPFAIGCMAQVQPVTSNPLTILGGFSDGCLQRWQAGDVNWYTGGGASAQEVAWSVRTVTVASQNSSQRLWVRKMIVRGTGSNSDTDLFSVINVQIRQSGVVKSSVNYKISNQGDFDLFADIGLTGLRFDAIISGDDHLELDGIDWAVEPRPFGVPVSAV